MMSSKNSSTSNTDEVFYSPNTSLDDSENKKEIEINEKNTTQVNDFMEVVEVDKKINASEDIRENITVTQSPRARRSYKSKSSSYTILFPLSIYNFRVC